MLEKTLLKALTAYRIELWSKKHHTEVEQKAICGHIVSCQDYLNGGNKANGTWMEDNHSVLSKAVKHYYGLIQFEGTDMDEEYQDLNKCIVFYRNLYAQFGLDY